MAPEVANSKPYNETCDVYSFAILLWEMLALKRPFLLYTPKLLREKVYNGEHKRPPVPATWSNSIKICLKRCWDADLHQRNNMVQVTSILKKECVAIRNGDDTGLEHYTRRSTFVFRTTGSNGTSPPPAVNKTSRLSDKSSVSGERSKELLPSSTERTVIEIQDLSTDNEVTEVTEVEC